MIVMRAALAIAVLAISAGYASAQAIACPDTPPTSGIFTGGISEVSEPPDEYSVQHLPCETFGATISLTVNQRGANFQWEFTNAAGVTFNPAGIGCGISTNPNPTTCEASLPLSGVNGLSSALGGSPRRGSISTSLRVAKIRVWMVYKTHSVTAATYTITYHRSPYSTYNFGAPTRQTAPLLPSLPRAANAWMYAAETQYWKIGLLPSGTLSVAGSAKCLNTYSSSSFRVQVFDADGVNKANLTPYVNVPCSTLASAPFATATPFTNTTGVAKDFWIAIVMLANARPIDVTMTISGTNVAQLPSIQVTELGFKGDYPISSWASKTAIDPTDGTEPTWTLASGAVYPAAYGLSMLPNIFVTIDVNPSLRTDQAVAVRAKTAGQVVTDVTSAAIAASGGRIESIVASSTFYRPAGFDEIDYTLDWELSFDNGATWIAAGSTGPHKLYWLVGAPITPTFYGLLHTAEGPIEYAPAYDEALKRAAEAMTTVTTNAGAIAEAITLNIDALVKYDPGRNPEGHPLELFQADDGGMCANHANLLRGLLRSIGIAATTFYVRGGESVGGGYQEWRYSYRGASGYTLHVAEAEHDEAEANPHFTFHAVVGLDGGGADPVYYDPSYGKSYTLAQSSVDETIDVIGPPTVFASGSLAPSRLAFRDIFVWESVAVANPPDCPHQLMAEFVSQTVPTGMNAGATYNVAIRMKNTGSRTWNASAGVVLVSQNPLGNATWGFPLVSLPHDVEPGGVVEFAFGVTAPSSAGNYNFQFRMTELEIGGQPPAAMLFPFGAVTPNVVVGVQ
jgi:hypothetical protein